VLTDVPATSTPPTPTQTDAIPPTSSSSSIDLEPQEISGQSITFWHVWDGARGDLLDDLVARFNTENIYGIEVIASRHRNIFEEVGNALKESAAPNAAVGFNYHVLDWASKAQLPDLIPYISDPNWGLTTAAVDDFYPAFIAQTQHNGGQYGLPFYRTAEVLLYNETWASELGFANPPSSPEELREQACAAHTNLRNSGDGEFTPQGGLALNYEPTALIAWMAAFGGRFNSNLEGEAFQFDREDNIFDREDNIDAFRFLRSLLDDGCAWIPEAVYPHAEFANRLALFMPSTLAGVQFQEAAMAETGSTDNWTILPYPMTKDSNQGLFHGPDLVVLPGTPEEILATWIFIKWLASPDNNHDWLAASGYFPARQSGLGWIDNPDILGAEWLPGGIPLEANPAWPYVQWVAADTARVLFAPLITLEEVDEVTQELDRLAEELATIFR
jgi:ABC-type glycerol-3-phosphate transport system substrate-binding protein